MGRGHKQVSLALAATGLLGLTALVGALFTGVPDLSGVAHLPQAAWASLGALGQWALGVVTSLVAAGGVFFYRGGLDVQGEGGRAQGPEDQSSLLGRWGSRLVRLLLGIATAPARPAIGAWNWPTQFASEASLIHLTTGACGLGGVLTGRAIRLQKARCSEDTRSSASSGDGCLQGRQLA